MINSNLKNWPKKIVKLSTVNCLGINSAFASSTGTLPFNSTMNTLKDAISGPFLLSAAIIMIVITCLMLAFGEWGDGFKKFINIVLWLSIAFGAVTFVTTMFGAGAIF
jgi:type IV secretory pathway VirB2 component (pilin)